MKNAQCMRLTRVSVAPNARECPERSVKMWQKYKFLQFANALNEQAVALKKFCCLLTLANC